MCLSAITAGHRRLFVSGALVKRPCRPDLAATGAPPRFAPTQALDYEIEAGFFVGPGNPRAKPSPSSALASHLFGVCLLNDWSARDIQAWEYQPLGPFLAKNFATTISPWIVTMEALAPFRIPALTRPAHDPAPLPYLDSEQDRQQGGIDLTLEVYLRSAACALRGAMRCGSAAATWVASTGRSLNC